LATAVNRLDQLDAEEVTVQHVDVLGGEQIRVLGDEPGGQGLLADAAGVDGGGQQRPAGAGDRHDDADHRE
jgi:hypothetical protein